uniref:Putative group II intron reverse transcriptase/maturase protein n=1 Tax=Sarcopeltis skottsbergii TaxID=2765380 RepID=A0A7M3VH78_SARSK|nr:putative group II intron reverse transcriptase/maturase protein [Sarcopeltis skottsbergii]
MKSITIDSSMDWKSLPWTQIQEKIFIIQQEIYNYSKECNQKKIHRLQNYILNSSDSKIFAIQAVIDDITKYYIIYSQENYNLNDQNKFLIYKSLFKNNYLCKELFLIKEQIKQYLVYLCLKPEWEARFEPENKCNLNKSKQYYFLYRLSRFILKDKIEKLKYLKNYYFISKITTKCIDIKYLISKIQPITSILNYLQIWLSNRYVVETLNNTIYLDSKINNLHQLLYHIMYCGFGWHNTIFLDHNNFCMVLDSNCNIRIYSTSFLNQLHCKNIISLINYVLGIKYYPLDICNKKLSETQYLFSNYLINHYKEKRYIIYISPCIYKYFKKQVRQILYHQNYLYKWKPNRHLYINNILNTIKNRFIDFYLYYYPLINKRNISDLIMSLEDIIFRWIKKNKNQIQTLIIYKRAKYLYLDKNKKYKYYYN